ncbi:hypothetical protein BH24CHL4_BH24CHL4_24890 [soil metagenome]
MTSPETSRPTILDRLPKTRLPRSMWIAISMVLVAATIYLARDLGVGWVALGFTLMPDLGLLAGMSSNLAKGQLNPRAVPSTQRTACSLARW